MTETIEPINQEYVEKKIKEIQEKIKEIEKKMKAFQETYQSTVKNQKILKQTFQDIKEKKYTIEEQITTLFEIMEYLVHDFSCINIAYIDVSRIQFKNFLKFLKEDLQKYQKILKQIQNKEKILSYDIIVPPF